jgi:hypothetical protein
MIRLTCSGVMLAVALGWTLAFDRPALADPFTVSYTDGSNWNRVYGQGFKASQSATPVQSLAPTDTVSLDRFQFFKSGSADATESFRLAILDNIFVDLDTLTTASPQLMGMSTNTIAGTASIATGAPISFDFDAVNLMYGDGEDSTDFNYAAIFVTVGAEVDGVAPLSPVLVPALIADYVETPPGSGTYLPESDYGDVLGNYFLTTTNTISGTAGSGRYLVAFDPAHADANFIASFNQPDELPGDFNHDRTVDAADYTVWRDGLGSGFTPDDYQLWKDHFRQSNGAGALAPAAAVPEPATVGLMFAAVVAALAMRERRCV